MARPVRHAWALLIPALWCAEPRLAAALQVVEATDGVTVEAVLAIKEATRIRIDGAAITNVFGNIFASNCAAAQPSPGSTGNGSPPVLPQTNPAGEVVLECDADKGEIYVRPVGGPGKPVNLFVSSQHATYTLLLRRSDTPADTIVIRDRTPRQARSERPGAAASARQSAHVRALKAMLVAMASDRVPADLRVEEVNRPVQLWAEARFALTWIYEGLLDGRSLVGERYLLTNVSNQDMVLAEQEFDRETGGVPGGVPGGVLGVCIEHHNLRPGDTTTVFVILQGV